MSFLTKTIVGIEIHDFSIEAVELSKHNDDITLAAYNRINIPPNLIKDGEIVKEEDLKPFVSSLLKNANPQSIVAKEISVVFSPTKVFNHIFTFPINLSPDEIKNALPYEAENVIPFAINDVYWDFSILEADPQEKRHASQYVLFSAISKTTADKYTNLFHSLGLIPSIFGTNAESLKFGLIKQVNPAHTSLIIDISTLGTNYLIIQNNLIKHFFTSNKGGKHLLEEVSNQFQIPASIVIDQKEKNNFDKKLLPAIKEFLENNYQIAQGIIKENTPSKNIGQIEDIFLTGEFLDLPNFQELAKEFFPDKNIIVGDPRKYLKINAAKFGALQNDKKSNQYSTYSINALGIAMRGLFTKSYAGINLLPDNLRQQFSTQKLNLILAICAISITVLSLFFATFISFKHQQLSFERSSLEARKSSIDKILFGTRYQQIRDSIILFNNELNQLGSIDNSIFSVPGLLNDLFKLIPEEIKITTLEFNDDGLKIVITGLAANREVLLKTTENLKNVEFIEEVITPISNYDQKTKISFRMELKLIFKELARYGSSKPA